MKFHVVLDTNVLVSALISKNPESATVVLLQRIFVDDRIVILLNEEIFDEYFDVLHRPKFDIDSSKVDFVLDWLKSASINVIPTKSDYSLPDQKDVMFVEVSLSVPGSKIVTGNRKHFPGIENVLSPAEFLELIENEL